MSKMLMDLIDSYSETVSKTELTKQPTQSGDFYFGSESLPGKPHFGLYLFNQDKKTNSKFYFGEMLNHRFHGKGLYFYNNDSFVLGENWHTGVREGVMFKKAPNTHKIVENEYHDLKKTP